MNHTQIQRISIIDRAIRKGTPNQKDLHRAIEKEMGVNVSISNIDKDIRRMKELFEAPVIYVPETSSSGHYMYHKDYDFGNAFIRYWSDFVEFNKVINKEVLC